MLNSFKMQTQSAVKQVTIDDMLYKFLPLQSIQCGGQNSKSACYQVARIKAVVKTHISGSDQPILTLPGDSEDLFH